MARFRGTVEGNRSTASRLGHKTSGLRVSGNGWNIGATVYLEVNEAGEDVVSIRLTSGSNGHKTSKCLGEFTARDLED